MEIEPSASLPSANKTFVMQRLLSYVVVVIKAFFSCSVLFDFMTFCEGIEIEDCAKMD